MAVNHETNPFARFLFFLIRNPTVAGGQETNPFARFHRLGLHAQDEPVRRATPYPRNTVGSVPDAWYHTFRCIAADGRLAQGQSTSFTRMGSQVQILYRPPEFSGLLRRPFSFADSRGTQRRAARLDAQADSAHRECKNPTGQLPAVATTGRNESAEQLELLRWSHDAQTDRAHVARTCIPPVFLQKLVTNG